MARMTAYINPQSSEEFRAAAGYTLADGTPALNVVCIFAANYAASDPPYLRANNNDPPTQDEFNKNIQAILDDGSVQYLQSKGLTVLLSITNGHSAVGWSQFTSETDAADFAKYLQGVVEKYGLDGIDVDDEYSDGPPNDTSLIMVTTYMKQLMPDKIITKALFADSDVFQSSWNGHTLAQNLSYGAEMSYGGDPDTRLPPYTQYGSNNSLAEGQLSLGFWTGGPSPEPDKDADWVKDNGYAGLMIFGFEVQDNVDLMGQLVDDWYGPGNWNPPAG